MIVPEELYFHPRQQPAQKIPAADLVWTNAEHEQIARYKGMYPEQQGAVMRVLWMAQEKFGYLPPEAIAFVADTLDLPYSHVYGVATFYTQYFKEEVGQFVLDVCTCFSCQVCGGYDMLHHLEGKLGIKKGETTEDGLFTVQEVECLGACGSAPMMQVNNTTYLHNLTTDKLDRIIDDLKAGKELAFESVTLPQDEDDMQGNRRSDVTATTTYQTPPVSTTIH